MRCHKSDLAVLTCCCTDGWQEHVDFLSVQGTMIDDEKSSSFLGRMRNHITFYANNRKK